MSVVGILLSRDLVMVLILVPMTVWLSVCGPTSCVIADRQCARVSAAASKCDSVEQQVANNYAISIHQTPDETALVGWGRDGDHPR